MDWLNLLAVQGTLKSLLQHQQFKSINASALSLLYGLSHPYMNAGKTIALTRQTYVSKVMSLLFRMLSRFVIAFLPRSKCLLILWLLWPSAVIGAQENKVCHSFHCFPIYLPWNDQTGCHDLSFKCWVLIWLFHSSLSLSSRGSSVPLRFVFSWQKFFFFSLLSLKLTRTEEIGSDIHYWS